MKDVKFILALLVSVFIATIAINEISMFTRTRYGARNKEISRRIYEESTSYIHGAAQELGKLKYQYVNADEEGKEAIKQLVIQRYHSINIESLANRELQRFLIEIRGY